MAMNNFTAHFLRSGLTNRDAPDLGEIAGGLDRDERATYCSGNCFSWARYPSAKGALVHIGNSNLSKCPKCGSLNVITDSITPKMAARWRAKWKEPAC